MPNLSFEDQTQPIDRYPDICPCCHHAVSPKFIGATLTGDAGASGTLLDAAFKCVNRKCQRLFLGTFQRTMSQGHKMVSDFTLKKTAPFNHVAVEMAKEIKSVSSNFENIYNQAVAAEGMNLDEIAGVGYRKALEFIIKDYCVSTHPESADEIRSSLLGAVIEKYVTDTNLKVCAKRAAWLGNDETHYVRKWADKDLKDLKVLIDLSIGWIKNSVLTKKYLAEMP